MQSVSEARRGVVVINFNAPELNHLAQALAGLSRLRHVVRPYVNKGRAWERALAALPLAGAAYRQTFGRRRVGDAAVGALTCEAGIVWDWSSAVIGRARWLPDGWRHRTTNRLHMRVREAVAQVGGRVAADGDCVVAYEGFALPAFRSAAAQGVRRVLNYPVAHHRERRRVRDEELALEPDFAATWPGFDDWDAGHEQRLDDEIAMADIVLLGSSYAADSFVAAGVDRAKLRVVPYGVDLELFRPSPRPPDDGRFEVVFAGQLTQRKGLSYLLRGYAAFAASAHGPTGLTLVGSVVGGGAALQPYAHLLRHVPHQTRAALAERYRQADVFVFPTLVEGMPLVVLEAMACGLPVIVTANGPADIVRDGIDGFIVPQRDADAVRDRLALLHADRDRCRAMGRNAARRAREFSWSAYAAGVMPHLLGLP